MSSPAATAEIGERFSFRQRVALTLISTAGWLLVRLIGPTLRYSVSTEEGGPSGDWAGCAIYAFWHRCIIPALYYYRRRRIGVMTSSSFDGEYIARIINKFGFRAVRGSSTRGGGRALQEMQDVLDAGDAVAFTIDGPRGPRYVAKRGPVLLARNTNLPIYVFHCAVERAWVLNSWDRFMIPRPFSRVAVRFSRVIEVPPDAEEQTLEQYRQQMQSALDRARQSAEAVFGQDSAISSGNFNHVDL